MRAIITLLTVVTIAAVAVQGEAQSKRSVTYNSPAANSKFTQQHVLDVGDVPGHQIRIYEHHRTFPTDPPVFDGVRVTEIWNRAYSDYTNVNGRAWGYSIYTLENGDKIFARYDGATQTLFASDGSRKTTFVGLITLTGGSGRFRGVRGLIRTTSVFDPKANISETRDEGEYWIE